MVDDFEENFEQLICECHLVSWDELQSELEHSQHKILEVNDLKKFKIIGHGCGQCLKTWDGDLKKLIESRKF